jgi:glucosamine--fructose-6-phosphate aminotransferase (isomerizing)
MCGIVGILGDKPVVPMLVEALKRLEYRGYDSAGIATLVEGGISRRRAPGKLGNLEACLEREPLYGTVGIGHTRWATHGRPNEANAHPHANERVAVVHNGIIENFRPLRAELERAGRRFDTETDTEVVAHLLAHNLDRQMALDEAVTVTLARLQGTFALAIIVAGEPDLLIGARRGSPLAVGYGEHEMFLGSDALALTPLTSSISYLEDGDWTILSDGVATIFNARNQPVERPVCRTQLSSKIVGKGIYRHFMQKEIFEQPAVIGDTLNRYLNPLTREVVLPDPSFDLAALPRLTVSACGTAYYAGLVARYWLESLAGLPVDIDVASEFRYRDAPLPDGGAALFISQSGETIDTLAALRHAKSQKQHILSIVNQGESAIAREADTLLLTLAGPEIGVASTKAFTTQLIVAACLSIWAADHRRQIAPEKKAALLNALTEIPALAAEVLQREQIIARIARELAKVRDVIYLGRGTMYPLALEGALKLKEITYIHADGYAAGEMKHGPIALIEDGMPIVVCAPSGPLLEKTAGNVQEVVARGGRVILLTDAIGRAELGDIAAHVVELPTVDPFVAPILYALPIQLLAYHTAVVKGTDVDRPRNLAKSVTVE